MSDGAARMREMARRKIDLMISEAPHGEPGPGRNALIAARDAVAALPLPPASDKTAAEPFAYFAYNQGYDTWEQVVPEHKNDPDVVAAYREPVASDKTAEELRLALETLNLIVDLYDARSELYTMHDDMAADLANRARKALAALSALTRPDGGE